MNEFNNNNENGLSGDFDSVQKNENNNADNGYTVTPEGGFYTKPKEEIIQDEPVATQNPQMNNQTYTNNNSNMYGHYNYDPTRPTMQYQKPQKIKKPKEKKRFGAGIVFLSSFLAAVIGALSAGFIVYHFKAPQKIVEEKPTTKNNITINVEETAESTAQAVAKKVTPSVVGIRTTTSVMNFFGGQQEATGEGSGVIYTSDGYIITNYHVIAEAISGSNSKIEVFVDSLEDKSYIASVVGYNISTDLAVVKIDVKNLTAVEFSDSSKLEVGQYVITIGNPGGLEFMDSVTYGIVSGLDREVSESSSVKLIQTDAAINPGNSGGALVNTKGQLVGINSSKIVSEEFEGMGFAIPSNKVKEICDDIISNENSPEPYFGISISEKYTPDVLEFYGFPVGAVVLSVADGSPAQEAGLDRGDIITEFNGTEIREYTMLEDLMKQCTPGKRVSVTIYRSGRYYTTKITVGSNN